MGDLNLGQLAEAEAEYERALEDHSLWEADPTPTPAERHKLAAQVTIRLSPEVSELLRGLASAAGVGYTSLIRQWIEERVAEETLATSACHRVHYTVAVSVPRVSEMEPRSFNWTDRRVAFVRA